MKSSQSSVFTLLVDNEFGVLTRITALIRRAGWNIRSLSVAETQTPEISRLTICIECRNNTLEQVLEKLGKQGCVKSVTLFSPETQVAQELAIVRVTSSAAEIIANFSEAITATKLNVTDAEQIYSVSASPDVLQNLLGKLNGNGLLEVSRTGTIALNLDNSTAKGDN